MSAPAVALAPVPVPVEPPPGTVVSWQQPYAQGGPVYTYVAVHVAWRGWFVSDASETPYSWAELFYYLIGQAPVWAVTGWAPLR